MLCSIFMSLGPCLQKKITPVIVERIKRERDNVGHLIVFHLSICASANVPMLLSLTFEVQLNIY